MAMSGATLTDKTIQDFYDLKMNKKYDFMFIVTTRPDYKFMETSHVEPTDESTPNRELFNKMKNMLNDEDPVYIVFAVKYDLQEGGQRGKLVLISWIPENCKLKERMVSASSKVYLKSKLDGVAEESFHATNMGELDYDEIISTISKGKAASS